MALDFGGVDALTAVQRVMLSQACRLLMRAEREKSAEDAVRLSNAATRMLASLRDGRRRKPVAPVETFAEPSPLDAYLAERYGQRDAEEPASAPEETEAARR
jgi:hypothetical protein